MKGDKWIIDRDERFIGGELVRVAEFNEFKAAKKAWNETPRDDRPDVMMFFARLRRRENGEVGVTTLACRE